MGMVPESFMKSERRGLTKLMKQPFCVLRQDDYYNRSRYGGPHLTSVRAMNHAIVTRAAIATLPSWVHSYELLAETTDQCLSLLDNLSRKKMSPANWDTPPI